MRAVAFKRGTAFGGQQRGRIEKGESGRRMRPARYNESSPAGKRQGCFWYASRLSLEKFNKKLFAI